MAIDTTAPRTRRTILAGALGGVAAWAASALGRPEAVSAHDPDDVELGALNTANHGTVIECLVEGGAALEGHSKDGWGVSGVSDNAESGRGVSGFASAETTNGNTYGVYGESAGTSGIGVYGAATAPSGFAVGVWGESESPDGAGVYASGGEWGAWGVSGNTGVLGSTNDKSGVIGYSGEITMGAPPPAPRSKTGVCGISNIDAAAVGVRGESTVGTGVLATTATGYALRTVGRLRVDKASGVATITKGHTTVTVTPGLDLTSASFVLLTPKADLGSRRLWYTTSTTANTITIRVSSAVAANLPIGWLLLG